MLNTTTKKAMTNMSNVKQRLKKFIFHHLPSKQQSTYFSQFQFFIRRA